MCSFIVQIVYGAVCVVAFALTCASLGMDAWSSAKDQTQGLMCGTGELKQMSKALKNGAQFENLCPLDFSKLGDMPGTTKTILACLILAIIMEVVCFVYNFFTAFACCCKDILLYVLLAFTLCVVLLLAIVVGVNVSMNKDRLDELAIGLKANLTTAAKDSLDDPAALFKMGSSFIMAIVALVCVIGNTIVCGIAICCAKKAV